MSEIAAPGATTTELIVRSTRYRKTDSRSSSVGSTSSRPDAAAPRATIATLRPNRSTSVVSTTSSSSDDRHAVDERPSRREQPPARRGRSVAIRTRRGRSSIRSRRSLGSHRSRPADPARSRARSTRAGRPRRAHGSTRAGTFPRVAEVVEQPDHPVALHRVEPGQRFVEDQDVGVVHECGGQLDPLPHALRVRADRFRVSAGSRSTRPSTRRVGRAGGSATACVRAAISTNRRGGESVEQRVLLRRQADPTANVAVGRGRPRRAPARCPASVAVSPHIMRNSVDLPAPFGPSNAVTPGPTPNVTSETATTSPNDFVTPGDLDHRVGRRAARGAARGRRSGGAQSAIRPPPTSGTATASRPPRRLIQPEQIAEHDEPRSTTSSELLAATPEQPGREFEATLSGRAAEGAGSAPASSTSRLTAIDRPEQQQDHRRRWRRPVGR